MRSNYGTSITLLVDIPRWKDKMHFYVDALYNFFVLL